MADIDAFFFGPSGGELLDLDETVRSHDDLVAFVQALRADLGERREKWENRTVGDYLGSFTRAMRDTAGEEYDVLDRWSTTAGWLWTGRIYE